MPISREPSAEADAAFRRQLRIACIETRLAVPAATIADWSETVRANLTQRFPRPPGRQIGFCWPIRNEPDLRPLLEIWRAAGAGCCLPVVIDAAAPLAFRPWRPETPMIADRHGIPTPAVGEFVVPDVVLVPLNAFDADGFRLGYGGGYFDRTLAALQPRPLAIGVGFEISRTETVRPGRHDQRLDAMVTEAGYFAVRR